MVCVQVAVDDFFEVGLLVVVTLLVVVVLVHGGGVKVGLGESGQAA
jgi:hypothetical protein